MTNTVVLYNSQNTDRVGMSSKYEGDPGSMMINITPTDLGRLNRYLQRLICCSLALHGEAALLQSSILTHI